MMRTYKHRGSYLKLITVNKHGKSLLLHKKNDNMLSVHIKHTDKIK